MMVHNCSREHDRGLERHYIRGDVEVYDSLKNIYLGRLVNIHAQGLMIMGDIALEEDRIYTLGLHMPEPLGGQAVIQLGVDCLWTREADLIGKYWIGCAIIDISPENAEAIKQLIQGLNAGI